METNHQLIIYLKNIGVLVTPRIISAFEHVDRADFVLPEGRGYAYENRPLSIGYGQTISQPYTVAFMLEKLQPKEGDRVLDVGSGSGWTTALLGHIVGETGEVSGLELVPELAEFGRHNIKKYEFPNVKIEQSSKGTVGKPGFKFDRILVSAAAREIPRDLVEQLALKGIMLVPVENSIFKIHKNLDLDVSTEEFPGFVFVPLIQHLN